MSGDRDRPVILVDDDDDAREAAAQLLSLSGFAVSAFADPRRALAAVEPDRADILVTDVRMPAMSGIELFEAVRARDPELPVILVTGHGDVAMAVAALKAGAWDFLTKPYDPDALLLAATRASTARALVIENRVLRREAERSSAGGLVGETPAIRQLRAMLPTLANSAIDVVLSGESGTGKAHYGRALHRAGRRARHRLATIDCATVPPAIVDRELFGHGGPVAEANRGTLLLLGLDRASTALQDQVARFATERAVGLDTRTPVSVDVRIVATLAEGRQDAIRSELYHRLAVASFRMPPLAERRDDIPLLFSALVRRAADDAGVAMPQIGAIAHRMRDRAWRGNVRELANFAQSFLLGICRDEDVAGDGETPLTPRLDAFERSLIVEAFEGAGGDASQAATALGLSRKTFYNRVARLGIDLRSIRVTLRR